MASSVANPNKKNVYQPSESWYLIVLALDSCFRQNDVNKKGMVTTARRVR